MRHLLAAAVLILAAAAHAQSWERLEGQHSGVRQPMAAAVQTPEKWREIWRQHDASAPLPAVDFSKETVVVVFLGEKVAAGVKVNVVVQKDPIDGGRVNVFYREIVTRSVFSAQVVCQPYAIVKVPRAKTVDIEKDGAVSTPEKSAPPVVKQDSARVHALIEKLASAPIHFD